MAKKQKIQFNCDYKIIGSINLSTKLKLLRQSRHDYIRINNGVVYYSDSNSPCAIDLMIDQINRQFEDSIAVIQLDDSSYYVLVIKDKCVLTSDIFNKDRADSKVRLYTIDKTFKPTLYSYGYEFKGLEENRIEIIKSSPFHQKISKKYYFDKKTVLAKKTKRPIVIGTVTAVAVISLIIATKVTLNHQAQVKQQAIARSQKIVIDQWKNYRQTVFQVTPSQILPSVFNDIQTITETPGVVVSSINCNGKSLSINLINEGNSEQLIDHQLEQMGYKTNVTGMLFEINKPLSVNPNSTYFEDHIVSTHQSKTELLDYLAAIGGPVTVKQDPTVVKNNYSTTKLTLTFDNASYDFVINLFKAINNYPITFNTLSGRTVLTGFSGDISINLIGDKS